MATIKMLFASNLISELQVPLPVASSYSKIRRQKRAASLPSWQHRGGSHGTEIGAARGLRLVPAGIGQAERPAASHSQGRKALRWASVTWATASEPADISADSADVSTQGGKPAEVSVEGEGKALIVSFAPEVGADESGVESVGGVVEETVEAVVDAVAETGEVLEKEVDLTVEEAGEAVEEVRSEAAGWSSDVIEELEAAARRVSMLANQSAKAAQQAVEEGGEELQEEARQVAESLQSEAALAQEKVQTQAELAAERSVAARATIESKGQDAAAQIQSAIDKLSAAAQTGDGSAVLRAAGEVAEAVSAFGQEAGSAVLEAASQTLESVTGQALGVTPGTIGVVGGGPMADPRAPEGGEEEEEVEPMADPGPYKEIKAFVAGAGGRTGRIIAEKLAAKSVPVRGLVRNAKRESYLGGILGVQVVEGDIYNYGDTVAALGDSNVILCAVGIRPDPLDPLGPFKEYEGIKNLIAAAKNSGKVKKFVFVTSVGVSQLLSPFNIFWGLLFWKKQSELELERSGLDYTIVRPGGLRTSDKGNTNIVMKKADSIFGPSGITRAQVADVCIEALVTDAASNKIVEVIADASAPAKSVKDLFVSVQGK